MRKKVCTHDFGLLGSVLEGFGCILRQWWHFLVARKRALEGYVTVTWPTMGKYGEISRSRVHMMASYLLRMTKMMSPTITNMNLTSKVEFRCPGLLQSHFEISFVFEIIELQG
jgi:hypothetical protein